MSLERSVSGLHSLPEPRLITLPQILFLRLARHAPARQLPPGSSRLASRRFTGGLLPAKSPPVLPRQCCRLMQEAPEAMAEKSPLLPCPAPAAIPLSLPSGRRRPFTFTSPRPVPRNEDTENEEDSCFPLLRLTHRIQSAFAASTRQDLQDRIDAARIVLDQIMKPRTAPFPMHSSLRHLRSRGARHEKRRLCLGWPVRTGRGDLPHRPRLERPVFIRMAGGSFGLQIGAQSTDLVLVAVNDRGFQDLLKSKFKIGGDASAAAGPVGRSGRLPQTGK